MESRTGAAGSTDYMRIQHYLSDSIGLCKRLEIDCMWPPDRIWYILFKARVGRYIEYWQYFHDVFAADIEYDQIIFYVDLAGNSLYVLCM